MHQNRLGYLLLYFLKASKVQENRMSSYKDYVNTQGSWAPVTRNSETKDLATSLLSDLKVYISALIINFILFRLPDKILNYLLKFFHILHFK